MALSGMELSGARAVITGAGSGIGRACALAFAARGADVVVSDLNPQRAAAVAAEVEALGRRSVAVPCDVSSDNDVSALREAADRLGEVDIVMSNVGVLAVGLPQDIPLDEWKRIIDINLLGSVRVVSAFLPGLLARGRGHVVTTASTAGLFPYAFDRLPYAATKAAVIAYAEGLALYLRPLGIGVTCLCPAGVATNIGEQVRLWGEPRAPRSPALAFSAPEDVGVLVADAIEHNTFQVLTAPETRDFLVRKATDADRFIADQVDWITNS